MADKSIPLILEALSQAAAYTEGLPLFTAKTNPGLFANNAAGKQAAQRCLDDGYLQKTTPGYTTGPTPTPGAKKTKPAPETYVLTEKGFSFLLQQVNPRQVLEDLVRVLQQRQTPINDLLQAARQMQTTFDGLKTSIQKVLQTLSATISQSNSASALANLFRSFRQENKAPAPVAGSLTAPSSSNSDSTLVEAIRGHLTRWQASSGASEDCPLPDLFRQLQTRLPRLTTGQFHDVLRRLHDDGEIYLHPWTGPLYDLPEPAQALLIGHMVAYYASLRAQSAPAETSRPSVVARS